MARAGLSLKRGSASIARLMSTLSPSNDIKIAGIAILVGALTGAAAALGPIYAIAGLLALGVGLAILRSTDVGLVVVFAIMTLLPFATLPFRAIITPTLLSLAQIALMGVWILRMLARSDSYDLRLTKLGLPILGFLGMTLFSFLLGSQGRPNSATLHNYAKFLLSVMLFYSIANCIRSREQGRFMLQVLLIFGGLSALTGLVLWALNDDLALRILTSLGRVGYPDDGRVLRYIEAGAGTGRERAIGTGVDPNSYGGMLTLICSIAATQLVAPRPILHRTLLTVIVVIMVGVIILTNSRAALGGLIIAAAYVATIRYRRLWWIIVAVAIVSMGLLAAGIGTTFVQRIIEGVQFRDQANQMRLAEFANAIAIIERYPWFGIGFGSAPEIDLVAGVSSIYLTIAERMGLLGLGAFLALMAAFFVHGWQALKTVDEECVSWILGIQAGIAAGLAVGLLDHYFFNIEFSHMVALFWTCIGLGYTLPEVCAVAEAEAS